MGYGGGGGRYRFVVVEMPLSSYKQWQTANNVTQYKYTLSYERKYTRGVASWSHYYHHHHLIIIRYKVIEREEREDRQQLSPLMSSFLILPRLRPLDL
jgi:hypothetical protein